MLLVLLNLKGMETLPILTTPFTFLDKDLFNSKLFSDVEEMFTIIKECINGSCYAITADDEILYNDYNKNKESCSYFG